ncbi:BspA family leucine-rich repeat surface protein [Dysgonomonas sp. 520]|uniref:BspA family leucine-rich repeat surface protein n=1 Tax=Dysgonomonas sp. 520 TaxID=2302931 RepID=UPI0013D30E40
MKIEDSNIVYTGGLSAFTYTYSIPTDSVTFYQNNKLIATGVLSDTTINGTQLTETNIDTELEKVFKTPSGGSDGKVTLPNNIKFGYAEWEEVPNNYDTSQITNMTQIFYYNTALTTIPMLNTSNVTNMYYAFYYCWSLPSIPLLDTSNVTNMEATFIGCSALTTIPLINTSNVTNFYNTFSGCSALTSIPQLDTSKATSTREMFNNCTSLTSIPQLDTSNVIEMRNMFFKCTKLTTIPALNAGEILNKSAVGNVFNQCAALTDFGGLQGIRVSYSLSFSNNLTVDSLMNCINGLADLTGSTTMVLTIGSTNLAKLSAEQIAIATDKNWTLA